MKDSLPRFMRAAFVAEDATAFVALGVPRADGISAADL